MTGAFREAPADDAADQPAKEVSPMKETAFHEVSLKHGAKMREMFGYLFPWEYAPGHAAEHLGTRQRAGLCDLDYNGRVLHRGPRCTRVRPTRVHQRLPQLAVGRIRYTAMCDPSGNMVDDGTVWRFAEDRFRVVNGDEAEYDWLVDQADGYDVRLANITPEVSTLALQGPRSTTPSKSMAGHAYDHAPLRPR
jgi:glycine cleavage system aminomethyltransferase T